MKTDNHYLADKVKLRCDHLPTENICVLDAFAGTGKVWAAVKQVSGRNDVQRIPCEQDTEKLLEFGWAGDNNDALASMDLSQYNVIDLDAYGVPYSQLCSVFKSEFAGIVFVTCIHSVMGRLPAGLLCEIGFSKDMVDAAPILCSHDPWSKVKSWLSLRGVKTIWHRSKARKHYLCFAWPVG
jgi:hypothetical protein